jgi:hypothetical protein
MSMRGAELLVLLFALLFFGASAPGPFRVSKSILLWLVRLDPESLPWARSFRR